MTLLFNLIKNIVEDINNKLKNCAIYTALFVSPVGRLDS